MGLWVYQVARTNGVCRHDRLERDALHIEIETTDDDSVVARGVDTAQARAQCLVHVRIGFVWNSIVQVPFLGLRPRLRPDHDIRIPLSQERDIGL